MSTLTKVWRERALDAESNLETLEANHTQILKERDHLRAQVELLQNMVLIMSNNPTPQYVQGLEAAASKVVEQHKGNPDDTFYPVARWHIEALAQALAAKEQQP